jgi:hypothetical protein
MTAVINSLVGYSIGRKVEIRASALPLRPFITAPDFNQEVSDAVKRFKEKYPLDKI